MAKGSALRRTVAGRSIRWDEERAQAAYDQGAWVRRTLADALRDAARDRPDRVLVKDGPVEVTAGQLLHRAERLAHALLARMEPGSAVSIMLPNWHEAAEIYLGATLAGMVVNPILPSLRDRDLGFILQDVKSRMIFAPAEFRGFDYREMLGRVAGVMDDPTQVAVLRGDPGSHMPYEALFGERDAAKLPDLDPDAVRMIMYTSGTTGRPKGVMHTHNSLHALIRQLGENWRIAPGDRFLVPSPISHIGGSIYAFEMPLLLGTTAVLMEQWNAEAALVLFTGERITHMAGATPFLDQLLGAARNAGTHLPDLKVFICGGASVPPALIRDATEHFANAAVSRVYGSTEVPVATVGVIDRQAVNYAAETDGRPGIAEVRLSSVNEICLKGPQMMVGYVHAEDEAEAFDADGFFRSGDQGDWVDGEYLVVTGRIKDLIIRNGENIAPKEIEDILLAHDAIADIAVVGLPDERTGERACAVVVAAETVRPDLPMLRDYLASLGVARFKWPEQIEFWDVLPRNDAGKVLKHEIRARLTET